MPSIIIIIMGGSIAGLTSGLMLARAGHQVTVVDRDAAAVPQDVEEAASWIRPTLPAGPASARLRGAGPFGTRSPAA